MKKKKEEEDVFDHPLDRISDQIKARAREGHMQYHLLADTPPSGIFAIGITWTRHQLRTHIFVLTDPT